jgi:hypothetical protein
MDVIKEHCVGLIQIAMPFLAFHALSVRFGDRCDHVARMTNNYVLPVLISCAFLQVARIQRGTEV